MKDFKAVMLLTMFSVGTIYAIRKVDPLKQSVESYVKTNLPLLKNYQPITVNVEKSSIVDLKTLKTLLMSRGESGKINFNGMKCVIHKCRLNDTLYSIKLYADYRDTIIAMEKPNKVSL